MTTRLYTVPFTGPNDRLETCLFVKITDELLEKESICLRVDFPENTKFTVFKSQFTGQERFRVKSAIKNWYVHDMNYCVMVKINGKWCDRPDLTRHLKYDRETISQYLKKTQNLICRNPRTGYEEETAAQKVFQIYLDCWTSCDTDTVSDIITVPGIGYNAIFSRQKLEKHRSQILTMLKPICDTIRKQGEYTTFIVADVELLQMGEALSIVQSHENTDNSSILPVGTPIYTMAEE